MDSRKAAGAKGVLSLDASTVTKASAVAIVALLVPLALRLSALTVLLLSPFILLGLLAAFILANLALGYYADRARGLTAPSNALRRAARPLAFATPAAWQAVQTRSQWSASSVVLPALVPSYPRVSTALNGLLTWIVRDFVWVWYRAISSHAAFPSTVERTIHASLSALAVRTEKLDLPALVVRRVLPLITAHVEHFRQSEVALRGTGLERHLTHSDELDLLLASRYAGRGKLHPAVDNLASMVTKQGEDAHMRRLVDRALPLLVPQAELQSPAVRIVAREIVACAVFGPIVEMLSDPDFWNRIIDQTATAAIRQQKLISRVRDILVAESTAATGAPIERISARTDAVHFDAFLRSIRRSNSLLDSRRLKNDIAGEIRKTRLLLANNDKGDWIDGEKTEHVVAYLDRLYTAKRAVDERISVLSGGAGESTNRHSTFTEAGAAVSGFPVLRTVLAHPAPLGYFMEFMDRRSRAVLVQFWLAVESFKNPLEDADAESGPDSGPEDEVSDAEAQTLREDMRMLLAQYLAAGAMPVPISPRHVERIKAFSQSTGVRGERRARRAVVKAQAEVEKAMAHDFEEFAASDLGFRARADLDRTLHTRRGDQPLPSPVHAAPAQPQLSRRVAPPRMELPTAKSAPASLEFLIASPSAEDDERRPLFSEEPESPEAVQARRMEAISAALEDIIAEDNSSTRSTAATMAARRRRGGLFGDDQTLASVAEDLEDAVAAAEDAEQDEVQLAGPGDLQLEDDIARLDAKLEELRAQDALLAALVRKAELTGDEAELKLLRKSQSALTRELRAREFQKTQFETQAKENKLVPGRTRVSISSTSTGEEAGEGQVVRYLVEVQQLDERGTGAVASGWVVARRYNDFWAMHYKLRERYVATRSLDFPGKRLVGIVTPAFVDTRRAGLEKYLQSLIAIPAICESDELRAFLSRQDNAAGSSSSAATAPSPGPAAANFMRTMYRSVAGSLDDMIFGPSMLDVMLQRLVRQAAARAGIVGAGAGDESLVARSLAPEALVGESEGGETAASAFSSPICDLVLAVFELNKENNWLRRQAVVVILQQVLGGTIERRIRDMTRTYLDEDHVLGYLNILQSNLWPGGVLKPPSVPRTAEEKAETKEAAHRKLSTLMPDIAANMIGRSNARKGARRIFNVMQNRRLNQHIIYLVIDEVFSALFPDA